MQHFYFLLGACAILMIAFGMSLFRLVRSWNRLPYRVDPYLLSPPQRGFQGALQRAVGRDYRVYAKVQAAHVIAVEGRLGRRERERAYERLGGHRFDFLVCSRETSAIVCAVNVAPRSRLGRRPRKDVLDRICVAAKLPFVRFRESDVYSVMDIEEQVFAAMHALRFGRKGEEPSTDDTHAALRHLSEVIGEDDRHGGPRPGRPAAMPRPRPPQSPIPIKPPTRAEPRLLVDEDVDTGPEFQIQVEHDEDRPLTRIGRI